MTLNNEHRPLRFAINLGNPVLAISQPDGSPGGITVELAKKIAAASQREMQLITYPTAGKVVDDAGQDKWDVAFLAIEPAREDVLRFTSPYITIESSLLVRRDSPFQSVSERDAEGITINIGKGSAYGLFLQRTIQHATLREYPTSEEAIHAFMNGEGDMAASIRQALARAAQGDDRFRLLPDNMSQIHQAICVPRCASGAFERVNTLLAQWRTDGTIDDIINQHIGIG